MSKLHSDAKLAEMGGSDIFGGAQKVRPKPYQPISPSCMYNEMMFSDRVSSADLTARHLPHWAHHTYFGGAGGACPSPANSALAKHTRMRRALTRGAESGSFLGVLLSTGTLSCQY